jgi:hypothetical protein
LTKQREELAVEEMEAWLLFPVSLKSRAVKVVANITKIR